MQTDAAAFEGWALALRLWCKAASITLDWEVPDVGSGHYQRFLYRVDRFRSLFPAWFFLADDTKLAASRVLHPRAALILNTASKVRSINPEAIAALLPEAKLEAELASDPIFASRFALERVDRQFPVGLFEGSVTGTRAVFTGGKSAIDLVGMGGKTFWLFELKAGRNAPIGSLAELIFYTSVIRDAAGSKPKFGFVDGPDTMAVSPADVRNASAINAVLLTQAAHPLLEHPGLTATLNAAATAEWNMQPDAVPVTFHAASVG